MSSNKQLLTQALVDLLIGLFMIDLRLIGAKGYIAASQELLAKLA